MSEWKPEHFRARRVQVNGPGLDDAKSIEVILKIDGKTVSHMKAREPGFIGLSRKGHSSVSVRSRADEGSIYVDVVEPLEVKYADAQMPGDGSPIRPERWQLAAIGLEPE